MGHCNYCTLQMIRKRKHKGSRVHLRPSRFGGMDVFVVPQGHHLPPKEAMIWPCEQYPNGNGAYSRYHVAWLMELSETCCC